MVTWRIAWPVQAPDLPASQSAPGLRRSARVGWTGRLSLVPAGTLIVARTNRSSAAWQAAFAIVVFIGLVILDRGSGVTSGRLSALATALIVLLVAVVGWYRSTHLSERDVRDALVLRDILLARLPHSMLDDAASSAEPGSR